MDRRTDRPDGSGGGSPTVVTSRTIDDDLIDDHDPGPSDVMAPLRQPPRNPAAARPGPATASPDGAVSGDTAGGVPSASAGPAGGNAIDRPRDASANGSRDLSDTIVDGVPALPADTVGSPRGARPKEPSPGRKTAESKPGEQSPAGASPAFSFGSPPAAAARPDAADWSPANPGESSGKPPGGDPSPAVVAPGPASQGSPSPGRLPSDVPPAPADPKGASPAAFASPVKDPPTSSPSSPARTFLRSGAGTKDPAAAKPAVTVGAGKTAAGEGPAGGRGPAQKAASKRAVRQAHLTIARVEPWSVMKLSFVVSLVAFVVLFVAVSVLYGTLNALGVFDSLQRVVSSVTSSQGSAGVNAKVWFTASKVLGYTALLGSVNIVLITAMSTIGAVVYNLISRLVGGVEVTLRETE